jgi:hypothetical protein
MMLRNYQSYMRRREVTYATPNGSLSLLQAQIDLALRPNAGLRDVLYKIDLNELDRLGITYSGPSQVQRMFGMPGGGQEVLINGPVPPSAISVVKRW